MSLVADAALSPFPARLTLREAALWSGAAAMVVGAHLLAVYLYYANAPEPPAAEAVEKALTIDLAPLSVSEPGSVAAQAAPPAEKPETLEPVEKPVPLARETVETVQPAETVKSIEPAQMQTLAPSEHPALEPETAETVEAEPIETSELAALQPQEVEPTPITPDAIVPIDQDHVVLPTKDVPIPTPRPEPPVQTAAKPQKAEPAPARKKTSVREARKEPPKRKQAAAAAPSSRGGASRAPRIDPARWQTKVVAWLNRHKRYPSAARSRGEEGTANVRFRIDSSGRVLSARVVKSSGSKLLDAAAIDMVRRSSPVPAPPPGIARSSITLGVPVNFQMR